MNTSRTSSTVSNALLLLRLMAESPEGLRLSDIASSLGLGKSTSHMLVSTLVEHGFADRLPSGTYRLGLGAFEVGSAVSDSARFGVLAEPMRELADLSGEAVSLAVQRGRDAVIVQRFESNQILRAEIRVGTRMPLHSCASGKYLLANMTDAELDALYPEEKLPTVTASSIRTKTALRQQFSGIIEAGCAANNGEYTDGVGGIATGVRDSSDRLMGALSIAGPTSRFDFRKWEDALFHTTATMAKRLGASNPAA